MNETSTTRGRRNAAPGQSPEPDDPLLQLLAAMKAVKAGDFSVELPLHWEGIAGKLAESFNDIVDSNRHMCHELGRVGQKVGREGQTRQRMTRASQPVSKLETISPME